MVKQKRIAVIPARGGSKRIPYKNIIEFAGKPLIAWTIEAALKTDLFDRVLVSTDDEDIAEVSKKWGADVPFLRSANYCDDSHVTSATLSALKQVHDELGEDYEDVIQLMPNCPLRDHVDIENAVEHFDKSSADFQVSSFRFGWMNPWWARTIDKNGVPSTLFPKEAVMRSQDLEELYCPTGAIWIAKREKLFEAETFYGPGYVFCSLSWESAIDIDDRDDLKMAQALQYIRAIEAQA